MHYFSNLIAKTLILYELQKTGTFLQFFKSCRDTGTRFKKPGQSRKTGTSGHPNLWPPVTCIDQTSFGLISTLWFHRCIFLMENQNGCGNKSHFFIINHILDLHDRSVSSDCSPVKAIYFLNPIIFLDATRYVTTIWIIHTSAGTFPFSSGISVQFHADRCRAVDTANVEFDRLFSCP